PAPDAGDERDTDGCGQQELSDRTSAARDPDAGSHDHENCCGDAPPRGPSARTSRHAEGEEHEQCHVGAEAVWQDKGRESSEHHAGPRRPREPRVPAVLIAPAGKRLRSSMPLIHPVKGGHEPEVEHASVPAIDLYAEPHTV